MHCVIETESYERSDKDAGLTEHECQRIIDIVSEDPNAGVKIPGTGGARKLRFPLRRRGKSGGVRVVTYFAGEDIPVLLLDVFKKGDRINLSQSERNQLKKTLKAIAEGYRSRNDLKVARLEKKGA